MRKTTGRHSLLPGATGDLGSVSNRVCLYNKINRLEVGYNDTNQPSHSYRFLIALRASPACGSCGGVPSSWRSCQLGHHGVGDLVRQSARARGGGLVGAAYAAEGKDDNGAHIHGGYI